MKDVDIPGWLHVIEGYEELLLIDGNAIDSTHAEDNTTMDRIIAIARQTMRTLGVELPPRDEIHRLDLYDVADSLKEDEPYLAEWLVSLIQDRDDWESLYPWIPLFLKAQHPNSDPGPLIERARREAALEMV